MVQDNLKKLGKTGLNFKRVRGRREFFDLVLEYIKQNPNADFTKLSAYFQYTTGATHSSINQALEVLENVGLIKSEEINLGASNYEVVYSKVE